MKSSTPLIVLPILRSRLLATNYFNSNNILAVGGFGNVYKEKLGDGTMVAVKHLKDVFRTSGETQFRTELEIFSLHKGNGIADKSPLPDSNMEAEESHLHKPKKE